MIRTNNLCFSYSGAPPFILDNVSLEISKGEYVSVLGDNGSGKSTMIRLILGLLKPSRGGISCDAKRIGYVAQKNDFSNSQFPITVFEMLNAYRRLIRLKDKDAVAQSLELVRMGDYRNALMGTLSGGQCQKVLIARAMMGGPELLVLDEPSTGVDVGSQKEIYGMLKQFSSERGITIISVEHNLDAAIKNSTLIYHLSDGHGHLCTPEKYVHEFLKTREEDETDA